jgi:hypothetical protein
VGIVSVNISPAACALVGPMLFRRKNEVLWVKYLGRSINVHTGVTELICKPTSTDGFL